MDVTLSTTPDEKAAAPAASVPFASGGSVVNVTVFGIPLGTVTTVLGAVAALVVGFVDIKTGTSLGRDADVLLVGAGLGTLLGSNPLAALKP